ncbi:hypothetical protein I79_007300 [Cricetulus griseus]|uniref:Uncharacterized protein n=1 Tax=Cricetulus griseus TaxID=10029 RepID=G3HA58_CRIGR|nr:hypothetical protein I79_007300 [Cricetulus griseus]
MLVGPVQRGGALLQGCDFVNMLECSTKCMDHIVLPFNTHSKADTSLVFIKTLRNNDNKGYVE